MKYQIWIVQNCNEVSQLLGQCHEVCLKMQKVFPELRLVSGLVHTGRPAPGAQGPWVHWWLMNGEEIVDPTVAQYANIQPILYEELADDHPLRSRPLKPCPNCGKRFWTDGHFCSEACETEMLEYMNGKPE